jgi:uncharacterized protein YjiS (DUF1127 family)
MLVGLLPSSYGRPPLTATLSLWRRRSRQRRALARLDGRALEDIGLTRAQAQAEADKPLWQA